MQLIEFELSMSKNLFPLLKTDPLIYGLRRRKKLFISTLAHMIVGLFHSIASNKVMCLQVEAVKD